MRKFQTIYEHLLHARWTRIAGVMMLLALILGTFLSGRRIAQQTYAQGNTLNVTTYGAQPNDGQDDTAGIQAALNAATSGDTVFFPAGTYQVSAELEIPTSGIRLAGASRDSTILRNVGNSSSLSNAIIHSTGKSTIEITALTLDGNSTGAVTYGILADNGQHFSLHSLNIRNLTTPLATNAFGPMGIYFSYNVTDSSIQNNVITNIGVGDQWGSGIRMIDGSSRNVVTDNTIDTTGRGGIFCSTSTNNSIVSSDVVISRNTIKNSGSPNTGNFGGVGLSIEVFNRCDRAVIEDNHVDHWMSIAAPLAAVRRNVIRSAGNVTPANPAQDTSFIGLEWAAVDSPTFQLTDAVMTDNTIDGGNQIGFSVSVPSGKTNQYLDFSHNTVNHSVQWGSQIVGASNLYFYQDQFSTTYQGLPYAAYPGGDGHGFRLFGDDHNVTLDGVVIDHNGGEGIDLTQPNIIDQLSVVNSEITNNAAAAIGSYTGQDLEWNNNTVSGNGDNSRPSSRGFSDQAPNAVASIPSSAQVGQPVQFGSRASDPDGTISHVLWNFGAGAPSTNTNPTYTYSQPGTYRVGLTVWDNAGRGAHTEGTITVGAPFSTGLESGDAQPTWTNTVDNNGYPAGGSANSTGICCGITGPEAKVDNENAHMGSQALLYSGSATNSSGVDYAYTQVFDLSNQPIAVGSQTTLSYWIYPQSAQQFGGITGSNSSCVAIDLIFSNGTNLRDSGAVDQNGNRAHPAYQCNHLILDSWNQVTVNLGTNNSGKSIVRIDVGYDQPNSTGSYRGYIDDMSIHN